LGIIRENHKQKNKFSASIAKRLFQAYFTLNGRYSLETWSTPISQYGEINGFGLGGRSGESKLRRFSLYKIGNY